MRLKHVAILVLLCLTVCSAYPLNGKAKKDASTNLVQDCGLYVGFAKRCQKALRAWEEVTPLPLSRIHEGQAGIMVSFAVKEPNLFLIAAHELRRSLGFFDLANMEDLMYPLHKTLTDLAQFCLPQDDVNGIWSLYGPPPFPMMTPRYPQNLCLQDLGHRPHEILLSLDAGSTLRGQVLFFKDRTVAETNKIMFVRGVKPYRC